VTPFALNNRRPICFTDNKLIRPNQWTVLFLFYQIYNILKISYNDNNTQTSYDIDYKIINLLSSP